MLKNCATWSNQLAPYALIWSPPSASYRPLPLPVACAPTYLPLGMVLLTPPQHAAVFPVQWGYPGRYNNWPLLSHQLWSFALSSGEYMWGYWGAHRQKLWPLKPSKAVMASIGGARSVLNERIFNITQSISLIFVGFCSHLLLG